MLIYSYMEVNMNQDSRHMTLEQKVSTLSDLFKVLSDPTRIRILFVLYKEEKCVYDIAEALNMTQSAISHQLKTLKNQKLVTYRREGQTMFYRLADDHVHHIFNDAYEHIMEDVI